MREIFLNKNYFHYSKRIPLLVIFIVSNLAANPSSQDTLYSWVFAGAGGRITSIDYSLEGIIGQPSGIGMSISASQTVVAGFMVHSSTTTGISPNPKEKLPDEFRLKQNFPNPFNPTTSIPLYLPQASRVNLVIYDVLGRKIRTLYEGGMDPGIHMLSWYGRDESGVLVHSGVYFYVLHVIPRNENSRVFVDKKKMILLK